MLQAVEHGLLLTGRELISHQKIPVQTATVSLADLKWNCVSSWTMI